MIIEDNGVGFDPELAVEAGGQGLRNIRERPRRLAQYANLIQLRVRVLKYVLR